MDALKNIDHRILDTEVTRIGNQVNNLAPNATAGRRGKEEKIIDVNGHDSQSRLMTVCAYAAGEAGFGPAVGRLEWGSGGGSAELEFDIPGTRLVNNSGDTTLFKRNPQQISIVASRVALFIRNDGNAGLNVSDDLSGGGNPLPVLGLNSTRKATVGGFIGYGSKSAGKLYRTLVYANPSANGQLAADASRTISIPSYARKVLFPRQPMTNSLEVRVFYDVFGISLLHLIAAGSVGEIVLSPYANTLTITNKFATMLFGAALFELEI